MIKMTKEGLLQTRQRGRHVAAIYALDQHNPTFVALPKFGISLLTKGEWVQQLLGPVACKRAARRSRLCRHLRSPAAVGQAHLGARRPKGAIPAAIGLALLAASFATQNVAREVPSPDVQAATL